MILAGITLFNPDIPVLKKNIEAIIGQVDKLICVDNGSDKIEEIEGELGILFPEITWIKNGQNVGIATALNRMFEYAKKNHYEWVLSLDQDSVCPENIIEEYKKYLKVEDLGALCPVICDRYYENREQIEGDYTPMDKCITSASLTPVSIWEEVGGFLDELFIDFVDHDFSAKLVEHNYRILRINNVMLEHEIGQGKTVRFLGKDITVLNHSAFRKYYMVRNGIFYIKRHKKVIPVSKERAKIIFLFIKTAIYENQKSEKLKAMFCGLRDAKAFCKEHIR